MPATAAVKVSELDPGRFEFGVLVERVQRFVPTVARLLEPAERRGHVAAVVLVDPDAARAQAASEIGKIFAELALMENGAPMLMLKLDRVFQSDDVDVLGLVQSCAATDRYRRADSALSHHGCFPTPGSVTFAAS